MELNRKIKSIIIDILKFLLYLIYEQFNKLFEREEFNKLMLLYKIVNKFKTMIFISQEKLFSVDNSNEKDLKIFIYNVDDIKCFCKKNDYKYFTIEKVKTREICIPSYLNKNQKESILHYNSPEIYVAEIKNAKVIGENSVVLVNNNCLYDMAKYNNKKRYNLRFGSVRNINDRYAMIQHINSNINIDRAISLVGFAAFNYYHFTVELISRLSYIESMDDYKGIPLLVDEVAFKIPQFKEILDIVNKNNREVIPIKKNNLYNIEYLIYPSYNSWLPINLKKGENLIPEDFLMAKEPIHYIKNVIYDKVIKENDSLNNNKRIFISRRNVKNARLRNEAEVAEIFKRYNFEIVFPEELTFQQQIRVCSQAEYVAGTTGAAFTNTIFCPENAKIMCIIPQKYNYYGYSTIAYLFNLKCIFLDADVISKKEAISMEFYKMDLENLTKCLEDLFN